MRALLLLERPKLERLGILLVSRVIQGGLLLCVRSVETTSVFLRLSNKCP